MQFDSDVRLGEGSLVHFQWCLSFTGKPHLLPDLSLARTWPQSNFCISGASSEDPITFYHRDKDGQLSLGPAVVHWPSLTHFENISIDWFYAGFFFFFFSAIDSPDVWKCDSACGERNVKKGLSQQLFQSHVVSVQMSFNSLLKVLQLISGRDVSGTQGGES